MIEVMIWCLQFISIIAGFILLYIGVFMHEDEEANVVNILEAWWVRADDLKHNAISKHIAFMQTSARLANAFLDRMFGSNLISIRTLSVTACLSLASLNIAAVYVQNNKHILRIYFSNALKYWFNYSYYDAKYLSLALESFVGALFGRVFVDIDAVHVNYANNISLIALLAVLVPAILKKYYWVTSLALVFIAYSNLRYSFYKVSGFSEIVLFSPELMMFCAVAIGVVCDVVAISAIRILLRSQKNWTSWVKTFMSSLFQLLMAIGLILVPLIVGTFDMLNTRFSLTIIGNIFHAIAISSVTNVISSLILLTFFASAFVLVMHRLIWPFITRPMCSLARFYSTSTRIKACFVLGVTLIYVGFGGNIDVLKQFFK